MSDSMICLRSKIAIVGSGHVGSTLAYTCLLESVATEIALIDVDKQRAEGEALDLQDCMQFTSTTSIVSGDDWDLLQGAQIVVITAGSAQKPGQLRSDLLAANVSLFKKIIPEIVKRTGECIIIVVTNPVDVLTYCTRLLSGFAAHRVIGSGTVLDSARLRHLIAACHNVSPKDVCAYVLGEHGESEFVWWSKATLGGISLSSLPRHCRELEQQLWQQTKNAAYEIIARKGSTSYAIAQAVIKIIRSLLFNQNRVFSVSSCENPFVDNKKIALSLPVILRADQPFDYLNISLSNEEQKLFQACIQKVQASTQEAERILLLPS